MPAYGSLYGAPYGGIPAAVPDHVAEALERRTEPYRDGAPIFSSWLALLAARWQRIDNVAHAMLRITSLADAFGVHLDLIGYHVVFDRPPGWDDERYRRWLQVRIIANNASGLAPEWQAIGHAMEPPGAPVSRWDPVYPRGCMLQLPDLPAIEVGAAIGTCERVISGGVDGRLVIYDSDEYFGFDEDPDASGFAEAPDGGGFLAADYTIRGRG